MIMMIKGTAFRVYPPLTLKKIIIMMMKGAALTVVSALTLKNNNTYNNDNEKADPDFYISLIAPGTFSSIHTHVATVHYMNESK